MRGSRAALLLLLVAVLSACSEEDPVTLQCPDGVGKTKSLTRTWLYPTPLEAVQEEPSWGDDTVIVEAENDHGRAVVLVRRGEEDLGSFGVYHVPASDAWVVVSVTRCR